MKPVNLQAHEVRGFIDGRQTQFRRVLKPQPFIDGRGNFCVPDLRRGTYWNWGQHIDGRPCTRNYQAEKVRFACGDILWAREAFNFSSDDDLHPLETPNPKPQRAAFLAKNIVYAADGITEHPVHGRALWKPSGHMPRWASRITLEVKEVRVQRLQEISEEDAQAEGAWHWAQAADEARVMDTPREAFSHLWDDINEKRGFGWGVNPWVVAVSFNVHQQNIDDFLKARGSA